MQYTRSIIYHAKHLSALLATLFISGYGTVATAETLSKELSQAPETILPTALPDAIEIEGDVLDMYLDRKMRASGNALISKGDQKIYGDTIEYDVQNDELQVNGNARIELPDSLIKGPALKMRLSESIGEMKDASITLNKTYSNTAPQTSLHNSPSVYTQSKLLNAQSTLTDDPRLYQDSYRETPAPIGQASIDPKFNSSRGDAEAILFEGQDKKRLLGARYTTCEAGVDDWYIKAKEISLDDYTQSGSAKGAYVEFKGVPLLYSPWLTFSFNNERKSGFLAPSVGTTSRSGFETLIPYYINIAPDMDATVATRYLSKRGMQLQGEFRYLNEDFSGINSVEYLDNDSLSGSRRYYANFAHNHQLSDRWSAGYNIEKVSDNEYFSEMSTRIVSTSRVNLPQQGFVNYVGDVWQFNGLAQKYQTLDETNYPYQRLPQLTLTADKEWKYFDTNFYSEWTYFDRNDNAPIAATGSRLTLYPSISVPFTQSYGFITPKIGIHSTSYRLNDNNFNINGNTVSNNSANRTLPIFSLDSGLYFERDTKVVKNRYTQTIEPRLFYVYIPNKEQDLLPVFDSALADLNLSSLFTENQFTGNDRVNNANQLSLAVTSRMIDKDTGIERFAATIGQRYYFDNQKVVLPGTAQPTNNSSDIIAAMTARLSNKWNLDTFWQYNTDGAGIVRSNILARYNPEPGKLMNVGYRYTQQFLEQINVSGQWPLSRGWYGVGRFNYSVREKALIESLAGIEYDAGCWQARTVIQRVETATADANYGLFFQLELGGLASIGSNPLNLLRRDIPGYLSSGELPNIYRQQNYNQ
ncbi:LPS-assembly protein LptD [Methylotenera versatilis]|uniref:LPS-assembly protein LptD n=1 Tax=Methylotenera versatilis TaxID=1055487 RepID=UPI00064685CC|nr:LPS-assembly protein LptD [Methylotenera versatilis]